MRFLFLLLFSSSILFSGELMMPIKDAAHQYVQYVADFPLHEIVTNNLIPTAITVITIMPIQAMFDFKGLSPIKQAILCRTPDTIVNVQNSPTALIFSSFYIIKENYFKANKYVSFICDYFLFWPGTACNDFGTLAFNYTTKKCVNGKIKHYERWGNKSYWLRTVISIGLFAMCELTCLTWYSFLIYQFPWLWKKVRRIPPVNLWKFITQYKTRQNKSLSKS